MTILIKAAPAGYWANKCDDEKPKRSPQPVADPRTTTWKGVETGAIIWDASNVGLIFGVVCNNGPQVGLISQPGRGDQFAGLNRVTVTITMPKGVMPIPLVRQPNGDLFSRQPCDVRRDQVIQRHHRNVFTLDGAVHRQRRNPCACPPGLCHSDRIHRTKPGTCHDRSGVACWDMGAARRTMRER